MGSGLRTACVAAVGLALAGCHAPAHSARPVASTAVPQRRPAQFSSWPWPGARPERLHEGVTHWIAPSRPGETSVELFAFDFHENPRLRFEIYDQDEDDATPFDDQANVWPNGVGQVTRHLNETGRGPVIAAWHGLFFSVERSGASAVGRHVAPVVLRGRAHYNVGNHRWTFGVRYVHGRPAFKVLHMPSYGTLASEFDSAAGGAQCLVRDGAPLGIAPPPAPGTPPEKGGAPSTPAEAGHIYLVDHMKTSRASLGWTRDSRRLYLLFVTEPDTELESSLAVRHGTPDPGGWDIVDLQRFWLSKGVWSAINSDGGDVSQLAFLRPDGRYTLITPRWAAAHARLTFGPDFAGAPAGGTAMTFYVRQAR